MNIIYNYEVKTIHFLKTHVFIIQFLNRQVFNQQELTEENLCTDYISCISVYCLYFLRHMWFLSLNWIDLKLADIELVDPFVYLYCDVHWVQIVVDSSSLPSTMSPCTLLRVSTNGHFCLYTLGKFWTRNSKSVHRIDRNESRCIELFGAPHSPKKNSSKMFKQVFCSNPYNLFIV